MDVNESSVFLSWDPIPLSLLNGVLRYYRLRYFIFNVKRRGVKKITLGADLTSYLLAGLTPGLLYTIELRGVTVSGGPLSVVNVTTSGTSVVNIIFRVDQPDVKVFFYVA